MDLSTVSDLCDLLHRVDSTTENWTALDLEDKEDIITACEDMRTTCYSILNVLDNFLPEYEEEIFSQLGSDDVSNGKFFQTVLILNFQCMLQSEHESATDKARRIANEHTEHILASAEETSISPAEFTSESPL